MHPFLVSVKDAVFTYLNLKFQFFGTPKIREVALEKQIISPTYLKRNDDPIIIDTKLHWKFKLRKEIVYPETFVTALEDGRVWGNEGYVITNDNILFDEVSRHYDEKNRKLSIFKLRKIVKPLYKNATVAVISTAGFHVYFHWMMDIVPRVQLLSKSSFSNSIDYFIISHGNLEFQRELLKKLNIDERKIIISNDLYKFHLQAKTLVVPSYASPNDAPSKEACLFLRKLFEVEIINKKPERKIYIQRVKGRKILNEHELIEQLSERGFEVIRPEDFTVSQQASLFSEAKFIIGPHGAGLTNIVFCTPGAKIIDIFSPEWVNPCYWIMSSHLNLKYSYLIGEGRSIPEYQDSWGQNVDITIDMFKFNKLFNLVNSS